MANLGLTYLANRPTPERNTIESALDHIYMSSSIENKAWISKAGVINVNG